PSSLRWMTWKRAAGGSKRRGIRFATSAPSPAAAMPTILAPPCSASPRASIPPAPTTKSSAGTDPAREVIVSDIEQNRATAIKAMRALFEHHFDSADAYFHPEAQIGR